MTIGTYPWSGAGSHFIQNVMVHHHSGFGVIFSTGEGVLLVCGDPLVFLLRARSSLSLDEGPRDGQGAGVLRRGVVEGPEPHLRLRRLPMRTIIRRRQPVVAILVGAVAFGEVIVGVGGVDAHD